ncbi:lysophospholipase [uncultured Kriegella sp.]|uniref:alpha/beta hydrolase n=1 Tax=uncultured Kriegella sp. TaxID=1798910 RepID=UPI0030DB6BDB|tara:strand:+ start:308904 stop:309728 length:825 start_codon:yes stop_codon:yes gene_type:complete
MHLEELTFQAYGVPIYTTYASLETFRGVVILVHGFGEHSGRYAKHVVPVLLNLGLAVVQYDNIGHGKSGGKRGDCPGYTALMDILNQVVLKAKERYLNLPLFLYGHSMGGNLVLNYALRFTTPTQGIVASSPYLRLAFQPPWWKMALGRLMLHIFPSLTMSSGLDPNGISRIPKEVAEYSADPLVHDKVSPKYSFPVMDAGEWAIAHADELKTDTLLLHGTADPIIDYGGTEDFHQHSKSAELQCFEGGYHELHHDECRDEMLDTVQNWLQSRL